MQKSRTDSRSIRSRFFITVCTERTTFSANPAFPHTCPPRGDMQLAKLNPTRYIISPGGVKTAIPNYFIHIVNQFTRRGNLRGRNYVSYPSKRYRSSQIRNQRSAIKALCQKKIGHQRLISQDRARIKNQNFRIGHQRLETKYRYQK